MGPQSDVDHPRMFRLAVEALAVTSVYERGHGWRCAIRYRRGDEEWHENVESDVYDSLTTEELFEAVSSSLARALGL